MYKTIKMEDKTKFIADEKVFLNFLRRLLINLRLFRLWLFLLQD